MTTTKDKIPFGEQAARWLADQPHDTIGYNEAARRFSVSRRTVKRNWLRLGHAPLPFPGEIAARWLNEQSGNIGFSTAARRFDLTPARVQQAWRQLSFGKTPRQKMELCDQLKGRDAARWLATQSGTSGFNEAAAQFNVSAGTVKHAWTSLNLGKTPRDKWWDAKRKAVLELAHQGYNGSQIENAVGIQRDTIVAWCSEAKMPLRTFNADPQAVEAGFKIVRHGGSVAQGANAAHLPYDTFRDHMRRAKVKPTKQSPGVYGERSGRIAQAALLVEREGFSIADAAGIFEIAPSNVGAYLRKTAMKKKKAKRR